MLRDVEARWIHFDPAGPNWFVQCSPSSPLAHYRRRGFEQRPVLQGNPKLGRSAAPWAVTSDGKTVVAANDEFTRTEFYEPATGRLTHKLDGHTVVAPTPDAATLAVYATAAGQVLVYDVRLGKVTRAWPATAVPDHRSGPVTVAISPAGDAVAWSAGREAVKVEKAAGAPP